MINWAAIGVPVAVLSGVVALVGNAIAITWGMAKMSEKLECWISTVELFIDDSKEDRKEVRFIIKEVIAGHDELREIVAVLKAKDAKAK